MSIVEMRNRTVLGLLSLGLLWSAPARADIVVTIGDAQIAPGGSGFVNVMIASDSNDSLNSFGFEFLVTTAGATRLEFVDPQPDPQLTDSNYVFFGNSAAKETPFPVGAVGTFDVPNDDFVGGDSTDDFSDELLSTTPRLLARLRFTTATGLPPVAGDSFTISLANGNTFFFGSNANSPYNPIDFTSTRGTVTITAVPEPTGLVLALTGLGATLAAGSLARRRARRS